MIDTLSGLVEALACGAGVVLILWIGLHASTQTRTGGWPLAAKVGLFAWLAAVGFALWLIFG